MKKWAKWAIILSTGVAAVGATIAPVIVNAANNKLEVKNIFPQEHQEADVFKENIGEYIQKQTTQPLLDFKINQSNPYMLEPRDASDNAYIDIFSKINDSVVTNDLYSFLENSKEYSTNFLFKYFVNELKVNSTNENGVNKYHIELSIDIHNTSYKPTEFLINNDPQEVKSVTFNTNETKNTKLIIDSAAIPYFYELINHTQGTADWYAAYFFTNAKWTFGEQTLSFNEFFLSQYSKSLNTVIKNVSIKKGYLDYKNEGQAELQKLTSQDFVSDIQREFETQWNNAKNNIGPAQRTAQILTEVLPSGNMRSLIQFFNDAADDITLLISNLLQYTHPGNEGIGDIVNPILKNQSIWELLVNEKFHNGISSLLEHFAPSIAPTVKKVLDSFTNQSMTEIKASIDKLLDGIIATESVPQQIKDLLTTIKNSGNDGIITFIFKNINLIINILNKVTSEQPAADSSGAPNETKQKLKVVADMLTALQGKFDPNVNNLFDFIEALLKSQNTAGENNLKVVLKTFIPNLAKPESQTIWTVLDLVVFNNANINASNLALIVRDLANPIDINTNEVADLESFANAMTITPTVKSQNYDQNTKQLSVDYSVKYQLGQSVSFKIENLMNIIPSINLGIININANTLKSFIPPAINFYSGDSFTIEYKIDDTVNYEIIPDPMASNQYMMSWMSKIDKHVDFDLKQTYKNMFETGGSITIMLQKLKFQDTILPILQSFLYSYLDDYKVYRPISSPKLNAFKIKDYDANKKSNQYIAPKQFATPEEKQQLIAKIGQQVRDAIVVKNVEGTDYYYGSTPLAPTNRMLDWSSKVSQPISMFAFKLSKVDITGGEGQYLVGDHIILKANPNSSWGVSYKWTIEGSDEVISTSRDLDYPAKLEDNGKTIKVQATSRGTTVESTFVLNIKEAPKLEAVNVVNDRTYIDGDDIKLTATLSPSELKNAEFTWTIEGSDTVISSTTSEAQFVANYRDNGKTLKVTATLNGVTKETTTTLHIDKAPDVESVIININPEYSVGEKISPTLTINPSNTKNVTYNWYIEGSSTKINNANKATPTFKAVSSDNGLDLVVEVTCNGKTTTQRAKLFIKQPNTIYKKELTINIDPNTILPELFDIKMSNPNDFKVYLQATNFIPKGNLLAKFLNPISVSLVIETPYNIYDTSTGLMTNYWAINL